MGVYSIIAYFGPYWNKNISPKYKIYDVRIDESESDSARSLNYTDDVATELGWLLDTVPDHPWIDVAHNDSLHIAIATDGYTMTSTDGINWTVGNIISETPELDGNWTRIFYGNDKFIAICGSVKSTATYRTLYYSVDGSVWNPCEVNTNFTWSAGAYGNGKYVIVSADTNSISIYSEDGITFTNNDSTVFLSPLSNITFCNGEFVAVGSNDYKFISTDGIVFTKQFNI